MTIDELRERILDIRGRNGRVRPWSIVHRVLVPLASREKVSVATVWKIANRPPYEPRDAEIREILGLDDESLVTFLDGQCRPRSQAVGAVQCACGRWYVSNHPRRGRCFVCSPYRGGEVKIKC